MIFLKPICLILGHDLQVKTTKSIYYGSTACRGKYMNKLVCSRCGSVIEALNNTSFVPFQSDLDLLRNGEEEDLNIETEEEYEYRSGSYEHRTDQLCINEQLCIEKLEYDTEKIN